MASASRNLASITTILPRSICCTSPESSSPTLSVNSSRMRARSPSRTRWMMRCFAACTAVQAAKQRIIQRVREGERARIREEFTDKVGELLSGEVQQIERGKIVVMLAKFREAEAIIPYREQNHREHFHQC